MLMHSRNEEYRPHSHFLPDVLALANTTLQSIQTATIPQITTKLRNFHVEIRNHELRDYKRKIRQQQLRTNQIDDLLERMPNDSESSHLWAKQLAKAYKGTTKYHFETHRAVQIFKIVEKFPNKFTLELLEIIITRAEVKIIDMLFQYDVMRLLHGFINYAGKTEVPKMHSTFEEVQIIKEVVISTTAIDLLHRRSPEKTSYFDMLVLARTSMRIISQLCKKNMYIRNFAVLNHKTYTYILKSFKAFGEDIKLEFYMFLWAATSHEFQRNGEEQFRRISKSVVRCFLNEEMSIKIELLDEQDERSYLRTYEFIILAMKNLASMKSSQVHLFMLDLNEKRQLLVLSKICSIVSQCNYVLSYPAIKDGLEEAMPIKLLNACAEFIMYFKEIIEFFPDLPNFNHVFLELDREFVRFLSFYRSKNMNMTSQSPLLLRRSIYFLFSNCCVDIIDENELASLIYFGHGPNDNIISLLAYFLENEVDNINKGEVSRTLTDIFSHLPVGLIEPLLIPSEIFTIALQKLIDPVYMKEGSLISDSEASNYLILRFIVTFFESMGQNIGERVLLYKNIVLNYTDRLLANCENKGTSRKIAMLTEDLLAICAHRNQGETM